MKFCIECGKELTGRQTKFCSKSCSKSCRQKHEYRAQHKHDKICPECGQTFLGTKDQKFCSLSHAAAYGNRLYTGDRAKNWRGGRVVRPDGYVRVYKPDSPLAHRDGYAYEHRLVANEWYPFDLPSDFPVHHLNGRRGDNRPENVQVTWSQSEHMRESHTYDGGIEGFEWDLWNYLDT